MEKTGFALPFFVVTLMMITILELPKSQCLKRCSRFTFEKVAELKLYLYESPPNGLLRK